MAAITKCLEQAIQAASTMPADQQDRLAEELLDRIQDLSQPPIRLGPEERAELEAELAAARRGEFAPDEEVAATWRRHGR
jgi:hypothetical protein